MACGEQPCCPVCLGRQTRLYHAGERDLHRPIQRPFCFFYCPACRLRFQTVGQEEAAGLFANVQQAAHGRFVAARGNLCCDEDILRSFARLGPGRRLLDVGPGDGHFLAAARDHGFDCMGVDVSENLARIARQRSGVPVLVGQLADLDLPADSYDWINFDQVMSYVPNPREVMQKVAEILRPGGICRIREYDADSLSARVKGKHYWMYAPTHVNVFSATTIAALAKAAGLQKLRVFRGTEASLASWLATAETRSLRRRARDTVVFLLRRAGFLGWSVAADTVYYLQKPLRAGNRPGNDLPAHQQTSAAAR